MRKLSPASSRWRMPSRSPRNRRAWQAYRPAAAPTAKDEPVAAAENCTPSNSREAAEKLAKAASNLSLSLDDIPSAINPSAQKIRKDSSPAFASSRRLSARTASARRRSELTASRLFSLSSASRSRMIEATRRSSGSQSESSSMQASARRTSSAAGGSDGQFATVNGNSMGARSIIAIEGGGPTSARADGPRTDQRSGAFSANRPASHGGIARTTGAERSDAIRSRRSFQRSKHHTQASASFGIEALASMSNGVAASAVAASASNTVAVSRSRDETCSSVTRNCASAFPPIASDSTGAAARSVLGVATSNRWNDARSDSASARPRRFSESSRPTASRNAASAASSVTASASRSPARRPGSRGRRGAGRTTPRCWRSAVPRCRG